MGRELKRVPLDFKWPLNKVWDGYLNPYYKYEMKCSSCDGTGYSDEYKKLRNMWDGYSSFSPDYNNSEPYTPDHPLIRSQAEKYVRRMYGNDWCDFTATQLIAYEAARLCDTYNSAWQYHLNQYDIHVLLESGHLREFTHEKIPGSYKSRLKDPPYIPTVEEVRNWSISAYHNSEGYALIEHHCKKNGHFVECNVCDGKGHYIEPYYEKLREEWTPSDPPSGEAYQLWETVSEGSPVTPIFATPEELAEWLIENDNTATEGTTFEQWVKFIRGPGWAPSLVMDEYGVRPGVQG